MHVTQLPPSALPATSPETAPSNQQLGSEIAVAVAQDLRQLEQVAPAADHADIRPLEVSGGLQVMLAEIRSAFELLAEFIGGEETSNFALDASGKAGVEAPEQAARQIVEWVLQTMPEDASDALVWSAALARVEAALQVGLQRADRVLSDWPEMPASVIAAVKQSGDLVLQALSDDTPNPLWLRPEWLRVQPRLERFWRRRRAARRHLTDPDLYQWTLDENDEQKS